MTTPHQKAFLDETALLLESKDGPLTVKEILEALAGVRDSLVDKYMNEGLSIEASFRRILSDRPGLISPKILQKLEASRLTGGSPDLH